MVLVIFLALGIIGAAIGGAGASFPWGGDPDLSPAPELSGIDLSVQPTEDRSVVLYDVLKARHGPYELIVKQGDYLQRIHEGRWLDNPFEVLFLAQEAVPFVEEVEEALAQGGCLEAPELEPEAVSQGGSKSPEWVRQLENEPRRLELLKAVRIAVMLGVARAQIGESTEPARGLLTLSRHINRLLSCAPDLLTVTMLDQCLATIHAGAAFQLASPDLESDLQEELWQMALSLEKAESPWPGTIRREARAEERMLGTMSEHLTPDKASTEIFERGRQRVWKRAIWLAQLPAGSDEFGRPTIEETYSEELQKTLVFGRIHLGEQPIMIWRLWSVQLMSYRNFIDEWHTSRCELVVERARWEQGFRDRGRAVPELVSKTPPIDPFTGRTINRDAPPSSLCGAKSWEEFAPLPSHPPTPPKRSSLLNQGSL